MQKTKNSFKNLITIAHQFIWRNRTHGRDGIHQQAFPIVPIIMAAGSLISTWLGNKSNKNANQSQQDFANANYDKQRQDNLADFTKQNEYNSPTSQMARLRDAGLNPHLVYGNGAATEASAGVKSADTGSYNPRVNNYEGIATGTQSALEAYFDTQLKTQQVDNLKKQNTVLTQESYLKAQQTATLAMQTAKTEFDLKQAQSLSGYSLQAAEANVKKLNSEIETQSLNRQQTIQSMEISQERNLREAASNATSIKEALSRMAAQQLQNAKTYQETANARATMANIKKDGELKELDAKLKRDNIQPSDNIIFRQLQRLWNKLKDDNKKETPERRQKRLNLEKIGVLPKSE